MNSKNVTAPNTVLSTASANFLADLLSVVSESPQTQTLDLSRLWSEASLVVGSDDDNVFFFVPPSSETSVLFSAGGDDVVYVGEGNNFIVAADTTRQGRSERDYVNLGEGLDTVLLGDSLGSYYTDNGWADHLYLDGFDASVDQLVLFGDRTLYDVKSTEQGSWVLFGDAGDTAIAYLNGITKLDLSSDAFVYTDVDSGSVDSDSVDSDSVDSDNADPGGGDSDQGTSELVEIEPGTGRTREFYEQLGIPQFEDVSGSLANDQLIGGAGAQQLMGFGGNDYAVGGDGGDLFVLGDFSRNYYAQQGWQDSVYIEDFVVGVDQIQLQGSASQYSTTADRGGTWLYDGGDAVAYLKNVATVDLNSFKYLSL